MIRKAFTQLYPNRNFNYNPILRYSARFKGFNGNIMLRGRELTVSMSREWQDVDPDIQIGLIQVLLNKLFKTSIKTINMDFYSHFLKKVHISIPKTHNDPFLEASFNRVNEKYLDSDIEKPNLKWGTYSKRKLGSYEYGNDLLTMSTVLKEAPTELLDLVMYHELLHKKHKFTSGARKSTYHTKRFREDERMFDDFKGAEKRLHNFLRYKRIRNILPF